MNVASLFNLHGPDLVIILLIVLLLFGAKKVEAGQREERANPLVTVNRLLVPIAIVIFLLACGLWVFGNGR